MKQPIIVVENLYSSYDGKNYVLRNVSFTVNEGELFGILGPNGAGKSTLVLHLNGILKAKRGRVLVSGIDVRKNPREVRKLVGIVFQDPNDQLFCPTVREEVGFGPYNLGVRGKDLEDVVFNSLKLVGMEGYIDREIKSLSFGEKKRVAIAAILAMNPQIVIFDEPFANLDFKGKKLVWDVIKTLRKEGKTVIIVTHEAEYLLECDRILLLANGEVIRVGEPGEVLIP